MPELDSAHVLQPGVVTDAESRACLTCQERVRIVRTIGYGGRVVSLVCRVCKTTSLYQHAACAECGATADHLETCSFATPWAV